MLQKEGGKRLLIAMNQMICRLIRHRLSIDFESLIIVRLANGF